MNNPILWKKDFEEVFKIVVEEAKSYLQTIDDIPAKEHSADSIAKSLQMVFPENGSGTGTALKQLIEIARKTSVATSGPKCYHFVIGGSTPAALGADWLASLYDQIAYAWVSSPFAIQLEIISLNWLARMFGIPNSWGSIMTTGATMSNFVGLSAARQWVGEQFGIDIAENGMSNIPPIKVVTSGHIHASTLKAMAMLGIGRSNAMKLQMGISKDVDMKALVNFLKVNSHNPCIIVATAGEPNAGAFDPINELADLVEKYNCWLHVDGAFGLFAKLSNRTAHLVEGIERAHSITVDGHKWLNVPYDCGFSFVKDKSLLVKAFRYTAEYLPGPEDREPVLGAIGPESSRRARSLSVWATLKAYGLSGYRDLIEHHLTLAEYLKNRVDQEEALERLAEVPLNVVCFRYHPIGFGEHQLNKLNKKLGDQILEDGRVYLGITSFEGKTALRPAISNWRIDIKDIDFMIKVILELGGQVESIHK